MEAWGAVCERKSGDYNLWMILKRIPGSLEKFQPVIKNLACRKNKSYETRKSERTLSKMASKFLTVRKKLCSSEPPLHRLKNSFVWLRNSRHLGPWYDRKNSSSFDYIGSVHWFVLPWFGLQNVAYEQRFEACKQVLDRHRYAHHSSVYFVVLTCTYSRKIGTIVVALLMVLVSSFKLP